MTKRIVSSVLVLLLVIGFVPLTGMKASAANTAYYDPSAALAYAKKNWNNGIGLCADFASKCLKAGGVDVYNDLAQELYYMLKDSYGTSYKLKLTGGTKGTVKMADNKGKIEAGDPIFYKCNKCGRITHVVISNGANANGYSQDYAHNNAHNGKKQTYTYKHCGTDNWTLYSIRMYEKPKLYGAKTDVSVPEISQVSNTATGVYIKWSAVKNSDKYRIYRKTADSSWSKLADTGSPAYTDKTASHGKAYTYTVRAIDNGVFSQYYGGETITRIETPELISVANTASGIKVKWQGVSKADGYYLYRKDNAGTWKRIATLNGSTLSYTDKNVKSSVLYTYTVKAYKGSVVSDFNRAGMKTVCLSQVENIKAKSTQDGIAVSFSSCKGADSYGIYRKNDIGKWERIAVIYDGAETFIDCDVKEGQAYCYTVKAFKESYSGSYDTVGVTCKQKYKV